MPVETDPNRRTQTPESGQLTRSIVILLLWLILLNLFVFRVSEYHQVPYSEFIEQVEAGKVERAIIRSDQIQGRAAEELICGKVSTGASDDIQKATDFADRFVTLYGMSEALGLIAFEKVQQQFIDGFTNPRRPVSPKIAEEIDHEVKELVQGAYYIALEILDKNRALLEEIAQALLKKETLEAQELRGQLNRVQMPAELQQWLQTGHLPQSSLLMQTFFNGGQKAELSHI